MGKGIRGRGIRNTGYGLIAVSMVIFLSCIWVIGSMKSRSIVFYDPLTMTLGFSGQELWNIGYDLIFVFGICLLFKILLGEDLAPCEVSMKRLLAGGIAAAIVLRIVISVITVFFGLLKPSVMVFGGVAVLLEMIWILLLAGSVVRSVVKANFGQMAELNGILKRKWWLLAVIVCCMAVGGLIFLISGSKNLGFYQVYPEKWVSPDQDYLQNSLTLKMKITFSLALLPILLGMVFVIKYLLKQWAKERFQKDHSRGQATGARILFRWIVLFNFFLWGEVLAFSFLMLLPYSAYMTVESMRMNNQAVYLISDRTNQSRVLTLGRFKSESTSPKISYFFEIPFSYSMQDFSLNYKVAVETSSGALYRRHLVYSLPEGEKAVKLEDVKRIPEEQAALIRLLEDSIDQGYFEVFEQAYPYLMKYDRDYVDTYRSTVLKDGAEFYGNDGNQISPEYVKGFLTKIQ